MTDSFVSLTDVRLTLQSRAGSIEVLRGISLTAQASEAIGIVGPSGSGKTTLLLVSGGLERPTRGKVRVNGYDLTTMSEDELTAFRRDNVGIVFQSFHLLPTMTALENVAIPLELKGVSDAFAHAEARLVELGLKGRLLHYPGELSGGEQQRVAIARALAAGARLILADEPTGNLDSETGREIIDLLFDMQAAYGTTLLLVTHDPALAARCSRIVEIRDGMIAGGSP
jgi:putative ABC transport system ATP-binding protein